MHEAQTLLNGLMAFALPGGSDAARGVHRLRLTEKGEIRSAPDARWIPFTAEETIETRRSGFVWEARLRAAKLVPMVVVDAYEEGRGRLVVKVGGAVPVVNGRGPEFDKGELQRYLANLMACPPALALHPTLDWAAAGPRTLRVRDTAAPAGTAVDMELAEDGRPVACRAQRPRTIGKKTVETAWTAMAGDFREHEGLRVPTQLEAAWLLPEGEFKYYRAEVTSVRPEMVKS